MNTALQLIVVTGGSKGIGRALVARFLRAGYAVATCARTPADLHALHDAFSGSALHSLPADLSQPGDCRRFAEFVLALGLDIQGLIHNTGAFVPGSLQSEPTDGSRLRQMLAVNLLSAYDVNQALLPAMVARGTGHIFTICSTASLMAYPNGGSYGIAKFALYGFTKTLREELKTSGIRVTAVLPGATLTASWDGVPLPPERFIKPEDVADAVFAAFSLSSQAVVEEIIIRPQLGDVL